MAGARLGYVLTAPGVVDDSRVAFPYHLSALTQAAGIVALRHRPEAQAILTDIATQRDRLLRELGALDGVTVFPSDANFVLSSPRGTRRAMLAGSARPRRVVRDMTAVVPNALRVTAGAEHEVDLFLKALKEVLGPWAAPRPSPGPRRRPTSPSSSSWTVAARGGRTGMPFFDHMLEQLGKHAGFDLSVTGEGRPRRRRPPHGGGCGIAVGQALLEALGDKAGIRRFASVACRWTRPLVEVALDLAGRPFVVYEVPVPAELNRDASTGTRGGLRPRVRPGGGAHAARRPEARSPHHVVEATFKALATRSGDACALTAAGGVPGTEGDGVTARSPCSTTAAGTCIRSRAPSPTWAATSTSRRRRRRRSRGRRGDPGGRAFRPVRAGPPGDGLRTGTSSGSRPRTPDARRVHRDADPLPAQRGGSEPGLGVVAGLVRRLPATSAFPTSGGTRSAIGPPHAFRGGSSRAVLLRALVRAPSGAPAGRRVRVRDHVRGRHPAGGRGPVPPGEVRRRRSRAL